MDPYIDQYCEQFFNCTYVEAGGPCDIWDYLNSQSSCHYPCVLDGCEIIPNVQVPTCYLWSCVPKPPGPTPPGPGPTPPGPGHSALILGLSVGFPILLLLLLLAVCCVCKFCKFRQNNAAATGNYFTLASPSDTPPSERSRILGGPRAPNARTAGVEANIQSKLNCCC